jgi:hypothetical protein
LKLHQETVEHIFEVFKDVIHTLPIMIAVRDRIKDQYIYNSHGATWTGESLEDWNSMPHADRKQSLISEEYLSNRKAYNEWLKDNSRNAIRLTYRLRHPEHDTHWIQCQFEKYGEPRGSQIIEISWDITDIIRKIAYDDTVMARLLFDTTRDNNQLRAQMGEMRDALESLLDNKALWEFVQEASEKSRRSVKKIFNKHFPQINDALQEDLGYHALRKLQRYRCVADALEVIRQDMCPTMIVEIQKMYNLLMDLSAWYDTPSVKQDKS